MTVSNIYINFENNNPFPHHLDANVNLQNTSILEEQMKIL